MKAAQTSGIRVSLIVAMAANGVIGRNNELPWRLPEDLRYFKRATVGKVVLMGRNTFESIGKPLVDRANIVVTRRSTPLAPGTISVQSVNEGLCEARRLALNDLALKESYGEVMVIGGAQVYRATLPVAQRLYLTEVHADVDGDTFFPAVDPCEWRETSREYHPADSNNPYNYSFVVWDRVVSAT